MHSTLVVRRASEGQWVGRKSVPAVGLLTRRLNYRNDTLSNARCLSKRLCSLMLLPHVLENGNDVPIPSLSTADGFRFCGKFGHILLGRDVIGRLVGDRHETGCGKQIENGKEGGREGERDERDKLVCFVRCCCVGS